MSAMTEISADPKPVREHSWKGYAVRFAFGGLVTAATGLIAAWFGPVVAGLFLAFPAILPATVTLVEKHRGEDAAIKEALGATAGAVGLAAFGAVVWRLADAWPAWQVLGLATLAWLVVAVGVWALLRGRSAGP